MPRKQGVSHQRNVLTDREKTILTHLANGLSNDETAKEVGISRRTIESHRARIMLKLNLHTLPDLVKYSIKNNLTTV